MKATIRLATAQPGRIAMRALGRLAPEVEEDGAEVSEVQLPEGAARFDGVDALEVEGSADLVARVFDAAHAELDLPPRLRAEVRLGLPVDDDLPEDLESRLWSFARIAAARHAPRARFQVTVGGIPQQACAWLTGGLVEIQRAIEEDLGEPPEPISHYLVELGPGDASLGIDVAEDRAWIEARDTGALEALDLACAAVEDAASFRAAQATFREASATPSEAAVREREAIEAVNLASRTGALLVDPGTPVADLVGRVGVGRVRAYLEDPPRDGLDLGRRVEALRAIPTPGRARAIVRLLVDGHDHDLVDVAAWLEALAAEPAPAAAAGLEELLVQGVRPTEVATRLEALDPLRAARALARASVEGPEGSRDAAQAALRALGPERVAEALDPPPSFRPGLESTWAVLEPLLETGGRAVHVLVEKIHQAAARLGASDPQARFLAARVAQARGDREGALRDLRAVADEAKEPALRCRARMRAAVLEFAAGAIEEALETLLEVGREGPGEVRAEARERMAGCFERLDLPDFAALCRGPFQDQEDEGRVLSSVRAWLSARKGDWTDAVSRFSALDQARPLEGGLARSFAASLRAAGDDDRAREVLAAACARSPEDAETWYQLARLHHEAGETQACLERLAGSLRAAPGGARALHLKGLTLEGQGQHLEAAACFERALASTEDLAGAYAGLARAHTSGARFREAAEVLKRSLEAAPAARLPTFRELGLLYETHLEDAEEALYWFQRFLTEGGADEDVLARVEALTGKVETYPRPLRSGASG